MKFKKIILLLLLLCLILNLSACNKADDSLDEIKKNEDDVIEIKDNKEETKLPTVTVDYFILDDNKENYLHFINPLYLNSEYLVKLLISTDCPIFDVSLKDVEMKDVKDDKTYFIVNNVIYELDELNPNKSLIFETEFPNFMPNLLLSYKDSNMNEYNYSITMSGKDSSIVMQEAYIDPRHSLNLYIGDRLLDYQFYEVLVEDDITLDLILKEIEKLTDWNLSLKEPIEIQDNKIYINFSNDSFIKVGPPINQKEEFFVYDVDSFNRMVLDSIKETLIQYYKQDLEIFYSLEGNSFEFCDTLVDSNIPW